MFNNPSPKPTVEIPLTFHYPITKTLRLTRAVIFEEVSFREVIDKRRSVRVFRELSLEELSKIFLLSAKVQNITVDVSGYILTQRPSASAGARHPIDIIVLSPFLNKNLIHYYNPFEHSLSELKVEDSLVQEFKKHVQYSFFSDDATIIWFIAHTSRTEAKYDNPLSLIWRDAGALIHSIQLACIACNVHSCPVGTLAEPYVSHMFSANGDIFSAGGILIG